MTNFKFAHIFISLIIFLAPCNLEKKGNNEKKFAQVYAEILYLTEKFRNDTLQLKLKIDSVLSINNLTVQQFDSIANSYSKKPEKWADFFEEAKKYLDDKLSNVQSKKY